MKMVQESETRLLYHFRNKKPDTVRLLLALSEEEGAQMKEEKLQVDHEEITQVQTNHDETDTVADHGSSDVIVEEISLDDCEDQTGWGWLENHPLFVKRGLLITCIAAGIMMVVIAVAAAMHMKTGRDKNVQETYVSSRPRQEVADHLDELETQKESDMPKAQEEQDMESKPKTDEDQQVDISEEMKELLEEADRRFEALHNAVFGGSGQNASLGCVTAVTGFTEREKREIGFLESDFLKDVGAFLAEEKIQTKRVIIEDRIVSSSDEGIAFQGRLEGKDDYILDIVFYPDLPGEYIFLLRNVKGNERQNGSETSNQESGSQSAQNDGSGQNSAQEQNTTGAQNNAQTPVSQPQSGNQEVTAQSGNTYDATNLSIKKIPETLLNYIDNRYEFQYGLYDWLYNHGKKDVGSATVTDYSINGDLKTATIELSLSDGSSMTAVYDKTTNSYSFKR